MRNIPTDLLRSFVTIIDLRGYRRAGDQLGRTQPAISLQMKRLQELLGVSLFHRGGLELTEQGEIVARHARELLAVNDSMLNELAQHKALGTLKLGIPNDYADHFLPLLIAQLGRDDPGLTFDVICDLSHLLLKGLKENSYDLIVALTPAGSSQGAYMTWPEPLTWVGSSASLPLRDPVRIVCYPEGCLYRHSMITALQKDDRPHELVYTSPSLASLQAAVTTGFGITALSRRSVPKNLLALDGGLPPIPDVEIGLYVNPRLRSSPALRRITQAFAQLFSNSSDNATNAPSPRN